MRELEAARVIAQAKKLAALPKDAGGTVLWMECQQALRDLLAVIEQQEQKP